jgi:hypothetical protein
MEQTDTAEKIWNPKLRALKFGTIKDTITPYKHLVKITTIHGVGRFNAIVKKRDYGLDSYLDCLRLCKSGRLDVPLVWAVFNARLRGNMKKKELIPPNQIDWEDVEAEKCPPETEEDLALIDPPPRKKKATPVVPPPQDPDKKGTVSGDQVGKIDPIHLRYINEAIEALMLLVDWTPEFRAWQKGWSIKLRKVGVRRPSGYIDAARAILTYDSSKRKE